MKKKKVSVFANVCPECHEGKVFSGFFFIEKKCSHCGLAYEKEQGYYFGPMIISYFVTLFLVLPLLLYIMFKDNADQSLGMFGVAAVICVIGPILYRYSKLVWLHLETGFAHKMKVEQDRAQRIMDERSSKN